MVKGTVFNIQRYSIHDGPGIRTVVFLKGCTLACQWCSNPESIQAKPQIFYTKSKCILCGRCVKAAPQNSIQLDEKGELAIPFSLINQQDLSWIACCPTAALDVKGKEMDVDAILSEVMKDEIYYRQSGGGLTLSGGEALKQADFAAEILERVKSENISTAIETAGNVPYEAFEKVLPWTDLFLFDFKLFDSDKHKKYIGADNHLILDNLATLAKSGADILVRMPVIPHVNDDADNLRNTIAYLKAHGIKRLSLLAFHQYGSNKYASIGSEYKFYDTPTPSEEEMEKLRKIVREEGLASE